MSMDVQAQYFGEQCKLTGPPGPPLIIGVAGGTASGKTSVCEKIIERLQSAPVRLSVWVSGRGIVVRTPSMLR